ncbi:H-NS histone family protein [Rubrivivax gelatinosus]|uniref:H-NS histone family protein n=1 Tax=Rubrivivax gelatinosus (strain NBRC 100245 / IL144) TaxID=983917 RepID=I0HNC4_RUBGI|nr:H-NS histone family protein [Rubrivivax gelatinosus]MBG6081116.1 DNA-binding protein H-NS [Rubrivivax gelatinosus]BAL94511.1 H-NS histone family protein [Rubrivivax gelatinosus IL144]
MPTYAQLQERIAQLQTQAEALKRAERADVVAQTRRVIAQWALTPQELFGRAAPSSEPKYRDAQGRVWGGRGPRPHWLREAIAAGARLEDFLIDDGAEAPRRKRA